MKPQDDDSNDDQIVRLDKWLWACRFYKTRSIARAAIDGGKVFVDGLRAKPSKAVAVGQEIQLTNAAGTWIVVVEGLSSQRRSASIAATLYCETEESRRGREQLKDMRSLASASAPPERPNTQERRLIRRLKQGG